MLCTGVSSCLILSFVRKKQKLRRLCQIAAEGPLYRGDCGSRQQMRDDFFVMKNRSERDQARSARSPVHIEQVEFALHCAQRIFADLAGGVQAQQLFAFGLTQLEGKLLQPMVGLRFGV